MADSVKRQAMGLLLPLIVASPAVYELWKHRTWWPVRRRSHFDLVVGLTGQTMAVTWLAFAILVHLRISWHPQHAGTSGYRLAETSVILVAMAGSLTTVCLLAEQIFKP